VDGRELYPRFFALVRDEETRNMKLKALISIMGVFAFALTFLASPHSSAQGSPQRIEIVAKRFDFTPSDVTLKKGIPVVLVLTSKDADHGLKVPGLAVLIKGKKGESKEFAFTPSQAGTFAAQCATFCGSGHGSMKMTFHVTD
jgi:cytochrome c oxidase subunit II